MMNVVVLCTFSPKPPINGERSMKLITDLSIWVVRPEGLEPPTFWFEDRGFTPNLREFKGDLNDLNGYMGVLGRS